MQIPQPFQHTGYYEVWEKSPNLPIVRCPGDFQEFSYQTERQGSHTLSLFAMRDTQAMQWMCGSEI